MRLVCATMLMAIVLTASTAADGQGVGINPGKVSAHLKAMAERQEVKDGTASVRSVNALATLAVGCDAGAFFERHGCMVIDSVGRIYVVSLPLGEVAALSYNDTVERLEAERMPRPASATEVEPTSLLEPMDVTPQKVNALPVYAGTNLPQAFTGAGVAAGVFDAYFDFTHPAFRDTNGDLRVKYYYDFHWVNADSTLGHALYSASEIAALEHSQNTRNGIHGTHVAGIMAGSAVDGQYQGMAPEADIYLADFNSDKEQFANPDATTSATAVLGFKYIFDQAAADGKPCVVNFSSGESIIYTSQRVLETEALQALTGPGRIIVSSAGNDGTRACYLEKGAADLQAGAGIENGLHGGQIIDMDLVTDGNQYVRFDFFGMSLAGGGIEGTIAFNTDSIDADGSQFTTTVSFGDVLLEVVQSPYQDPRGTVYHIHGTMPNAVYLLLCGATVLLTSDNPAWIYSDISYSPLLNVSGVPQYSFAKTGYSITWPAVLPGIIAAGATCYRPTVTNIDGGTYDGMVSFAPNQTGQRAKFSSCGPTFDGRTKPDVVAPGFNIVAPYNSFYTDFAGVRNCIVSSVNSNGQTYYYLAESGTSMAAPVVSGVIALWLQAKPDLTPAQIMEVIRLTATHPEDTMVYPNNSYGYGQIDAYRGLLEVLNLPVNIPELSREQPLGVRFRVVNRHLYADFGADNPQRIDFKIYSIDGRLIMTQSGKRDVDLTALGSGVYAVQLVTDSKATTGSTLIRL